MRLVLYGGIADANIDLDLATLRMSGSKSPVVSYIPSCSYDCESEYYDFVAHFSTIGAKRFLYFPIDVPFDDILMREVFNGDVIHLSGGNTFYFLSSLRKSGLIPQMKRFVKRGGVLTGLSAGAILLTPTVHTASFPAFDCDDNDENLRNFKCLNLVNFEFFPHYKNSLRYDQALKAHSKKSSLPVYGCPDGHGIVIDGKVMSFSGKAYCFFRGNKLSINPTPKKIAA